jgi:pimeloyl-ACP methyl ester carboxylesterase
MNTFYSYYGKKIHYSAKGEGNAIVLLHGFTETLNIWNEFSDRLSQSFRVICIDLPGHGLSECIADTHSMDLMADCVKKVLAHLGINELVLAGHSMGGYVSLALTEKYPEMIKGLCLFHSTAYADSDETRENRRRTNEFIRKNHFHFLCDFIPSLFTEPNQEKYKEEIKKLIHVAKQMSAEAVIAANSGMGARPDRTDVLKNSKFPVIIIAGKQDSRMPFEKALEQIAMPNDCVALVMGDVAHMGYLEAKEKTFYALKTFADGCF